MVMRRSLSRALALAVLLAPAGIAATTPASATPLAQGTMPPAVRQRVMLAPAETISVVTKGTGTPVVLIPGLLGSAFGYRHLVSALASVGYRAIVIEPLGAGGSSRPRQADYSLTGQARRVAAVMDTLRVGQAIVVAHSIGSSLALRMAAKRPELVRGIVSIEGGAAERTATRGVANVLRFAPLLRYLGGPAIIRSRIANGLRKSSGDASWVTDDIVAEYVRPYSRDFTESMKALQRVAATAEPEELAPQLPRVRAPLRILVGAAEHDGRVGDNELQLLRTRVPDVRIDSIAGVGHFIHEERPAVVLAAIRALAPPRP